MHKITMTLETTSITKAIRQLKAYRKWVDSKRRELLQRLADRGYLTASVIMGEHMWTGSTATSLKTRWVGPNTIALIAESEAIMFLEFGSGVIGASSAQNPLAGEMGMGPGSYPGQTNALNPNGWWFPTDDPSLIQVTTEDGQGLGHSKGMPAAMPMYRASRNILLDVEKIAREVFSK